MKKRLEGNLKFAPQPVLMIGTYDENGVANLMNAAWGGQSDYNEIFISLAEHKTTDNFAKTGEFTVSFATAKTVAESDYFGLESGRNVNKIEKTGFTPVKSDKVNAPLFAEYPITLECRVSKFDDHGILWGEVVGMVVDEEVLDEQGRIDLQKAGAISFDPCTNSYRLIGDKVADAFKAGLIYKK